MAKAGGCRGRWPERLGEFIRAKKITCRACVQLYCMSFEKIKKIHCVGIGGIGVSAAAKFFLSRGATVTGSDVFSTAITRDLELRGARIFYEHQAANVAADVDLIIYSPAVSKDNPELLKGVSELSYPEFLGELSRQYFTIAVSGTHGKSTTTALIGLILEAAGFDPLVIVGSRVPGWELCNIRIPVSLRGSAATEAISNNKKYFVVEACEHQANMLNIHPQVVVVTNMEPDHLDFYGNFDNVKNAFQKFIQLVPKNGLVVYNGDREAELDWNYARPSVLKLIWQMFFKTRPRWRSFGFNTPNDYQALDREVKNSSQFFNVQSTLAKFHVKLNIPGKFNAYNALAAIAATLELGAPIEVCQQVLANFKGIWRRFEILKEKPLIISDYGHHPTAIIETVKATREFYPGRRIVLVYQPHQHHRTKMLFNDFAQALSLPDVLILSDIYDVAGREETADQDVNSLKLLEMIKLSGGVGEYHYGGDIVETERLAREIIKENDAVLVVGAGDVDSVARNLFK
ncbi:MAG: UDP-N-acetylmuramate-L-alanine ligase [Candidatus Magasanikbacteria bacterium GW2011_GWC2_41_17]|uniref:UDP-N-acetylmuramate--L-alanine ligase n=2 Tax=Candidatus Magasanikiibacteriota TaxID=1752731 RepID=A0A0G0ZI95_9BACT|nr:MAG: UDP-N-acetylmuramate-L-alanine ligase [Candidatus Magasanikbacteria bacterium GW2011_GWC2_41_17]KKS12718.1 MAG: UDP-N-acetylmuramate-L-alanine ligase [Candidatus Magasanikbacteria bacterium GW2011_GWA2_41_55]